MPKKKETESSSETKETKKKSTTKSKSATENSKTTTEKSSTAIDNKEKAASSKKNRKSEPVAVSTKKTDKEKSKASTTSKSQTKSKKSSTAATTAATKGKTTKSTTSSKSSKAEPVAVSAKKTEKKKSKQSTPGSALAGFLLSNSKNSKELEKKLASTEKHNDFSEVQKEILAKKEKQKEALPPWTRRSWVIEGDEYLQRSKAGLQKKSQSDSLNSKRYQNVSEEEVNQIIKHIQHTYSKKRKDGKLA